MNRSKIRLALAVLICLLLSGYEMYSRAGGSGGRSSSGGDDGGGIISTIFYILMLIPFPWNLVVIAIIVIGGYFFNKNVKAKSVLNTIPNAGSSVPDEMRILAPFIAQNPGFNSQAFLEKVKIAFVKIQEAWQNQNLKDVRKWMSDGVYQRFNTQFIMMKQLNQTNIINKVQINRVFVDAYETDGNYDILHVAVQFEMDDKFVTADFPQLNEEGYYEDVEYWTFIRKKGIVEKDLYHTNNCPSCGSELPRNGGEVSKCDACGTITTLGDYDWVLSEITQAADYVNEPAKFDKSGKITQRIRETVQHVPDFSAQLAEDKASNAYLQILTAQVKRKPEVARRFVDDMVYEKLSKKIKESKPFAFNRLFLNNVTLMDGFTADNKNNLVFSIKRSSQEVSVEGGKLQLLDQSIYATNEILVMSRDANAGSPKGSLYAHSCPGCGAPIGDTTDVKCSFCGAEVNSSKYEWIVTGLMTAGEYGGWLSKHGDKSMLAANVNPEDLDSLFDVRDYALNNVMIILAADGEFAEEEMVFATKLASKWNYKPEKLTGMFDLAKQGSLVIRLPEDYKKGMKVYRMMEKAAQSDGTVSPEEQLILDDVKMKIAKMMVS